MENDTKQLLIVFIMFIVILFTAWCGIEYKYQSEINEVIPEVIHK